MTYVESGYSFQNRRLPTIALALLAMSWLAPMALALEAPCAPGNASVWAPAAKDFLGTSASNPSRVYFTVPKAS